MVYEKIPIVDTARRCGININSRTLHHREVEATCPFCHDRGPGKYHLSLNTGTDQYRCNLCGAHGNSVMSAPFENVDFRRNGVSFLTGQHTGVIQP